MRSRRSVLWSISLGALILAAVGVGCFLFADRIVTLIAARNLESIAAEVSTSTSIEALFEAMVGDMIARLRIVGVLLSGLGGLSLVGRRFIGAYLVDVAAAFPPFVRALYRKSTTWALTEDRLHLASLAAIGVLGVALRLAFSIPADALRRGVHLQQFCLRPVVYWAGKLCRAEQPSVSYPAGPPRHAVWLGGMVDFDSPPSWPGFWPSRRPMASRDVCTTSTPRCLPRGSSPARRP